MGIGRQAPLFESKVCPSPSVLSDGAGSSLSGPRCQEMAHLSQPLLYRSPFTSGGHPSAFRTGSKKFDHAPQFSCLGHD